LNRSLQVLCWVACLGLPRIATAEVLDILVPDNVIQAAPGTIVEVSTLLTNPTSEVVYLNGITSGVSEELAQVDVFAPFETYKPESLGPGESWEGPTLRLTISPTATLAVHVCDLVLTGGSHPYDNQLIGLTFFSVDDSTITTDTQSWNTADTRIRTAPNPFRSAQSIDFVARSAGRFEVAVFDVSGRRVAVLHSGDLAAGPHRFSWNGKSDSGESQSNGVYFVRVVGNNVAVKTKVLKVQ
jgi:hypothetical protein